MNDEINDLSTRLEMKSENLAKAEEARQELASKVLNLDL